MMKSQRFFLCREVDSYVSLSTPEKDDGWPYYSLKISDCNRSISMEFKPGKKGVAKLKKFRKLINELYAELGGTDE